MISAPPAEKSGVFYNNPGIIQYIKILSHHFFIDPDLAPGAVVKPADAFKKHRFP